MVTRLDFCTFHKGLFNGGGAACVNCGLRGVRKFFYACRFSSRVLITVVCVFQLSCELKGREAAFGHLRVVHGSVV